MVSGPPATPVPCGDQKRVIGRHVWVLRPDWEGLGVIDGPAKGTARDKTGCRLTGGAAPDCVLGDMVAYAMAPSLVLPLRSILSRVEM